MAPATHQVKKLTLKSLTDKLLDPHVLVGDVLGQCPPGRLVVVLVLALTADGRAVHGAPSVMQLEEAQSCPLHLQLRAGERRLLAAYRCLSIATKMHVRHGLC